MGIVNGYGYKDTSSSSSSSSKTDISGFSNEINNIFKNSATNIQNMTPQELAILDSMLQQAAGFVGTAQANSQQAMQEILAQLTSASQLTREQALADTQGLISQAMRQLQEGALQQQQFQATGAGASQDALLALLGNDAAARTAEAVGAERAKTVAEYVNAGSNASASLAGALANLNANNPFEAITALLNVAKGATSNQTTQSSQFGQTYKQFGQTTTTESKGNQNSQTYSRDITNQRTPADAFASAIGAVIGR